MIGLLLFPLAAHAGVYEQIKEKVEQELIREGAEPMVSLYVSAIEYPRWQMTPAEVDAALLGNMPGACADEPDKPAGNRPDCMSLMDEVQKIVEEEQRVRAFGRKVQLIALSQELGALPGGEAQGLSDEDMQGLIKLWSAGSEPTQASDNPCEEFDTSRVEGPLQTLGNELKAIGSTDPDELTGLIAKLSNGFLLEEGERAPTYPEPTVLPQSGPGTERQYFTAQWPRIESAMRGIWQERPEAPCFSIKNEELGGALPENVELWARADLPGDPVGDVGLRWGIALEPVMPSLLPQGFAACAKESNPGSCGDAILGGRYPPAPERKEGNTMVPVDGSTLCTNPSAQDGSLCSPPEEASLRTCPRPGGVSATEISLTACVPEEEDDEQLSSGDVCKEILWRMTPGGRNGSSVADVQTQCAVDPADIVCGPSAFEGGQTQPKDDQGHIAVRISENPPAPATYVLLHELAHAEQYCTQAPGQDIFDAPTQEELNRRCCAYEGEAYRVSCQAMEQDKVFQNSDGSRRTIDDVPVTAESCAEAATDASCKGLTNLGCPVSRTYPEGFTDDINALARSNNQANVPATCSQAKNPATMDKRVVAKLQRLEGKYDVCTPLNETEYGNRIGNNLCFISECAEQVQSLHQIPGGRVPMTALDEAAPYDRVTEPLLLGLGARETSTVAQEGDSAYPPYRPKQLVLEMDAAVCELLGLPPRTPPILCAFSLDRRLDNPLSQYSAITQSLLQQSNLAEEEITGLEGIAPAVGSFLGGEMQRRQAAGMTNDFASLLTLANQLLAMMKDTEFPAQMCPLDGSLPLPYSSSASSSAR